MLLTLGDFNELSVALQTFNTVAKTLQSKEIFKQSSGREFIDHILYQAYSRTVSHQSHLLNHYEGK